MRKTKAKQPRIPVVDLFAGAGGFGEGFANPGPGKTGHSDFEIVLSVERIPPDKQTGRENLKQYPFQTLRLRSLLHQFGYGKFPKEYYSQLEGLDATSNGEKIWEELREIYPDQATAAENATLNVELGNSKQQKELDNRLKNVIGNADHWVLIGGPPCQAYSQVGSVKMRSQPGYNPEDDERHFLYREYLKVIAKFLPSVFIMENVEGLLYASVKNENIFDGIYDDLHKPRKVVSVTTPPQGRGTTYQLMPVNLNDAGCPEQKVIYRI